MFQRSVQRTVQCAQGAARPARRAQRQRKPTGHNHAGEACCAPRNRRNLHLSTTDRGSHPHDLRSTRGRAERAAAAARSPPPFVTGISWEETEPIRAPLAPLYRSSTAPRPQSKKIINCLCGVETQSNGTAHYARLTQKQGLQEVGYGSAWRHHIAVLIRFCEILDFPL